MLAAEVVGSGDPVVFLHAAICDRRMWHGQMRSPGPGHAAIAYDRRGFGETRCEAGPFSDVEDLAAVLDAAASNRPAILVACSAGGRIAIDAALRHPSRIRGLILVSPSVSGAPEPSHLPDIARLMATLKEAQEAGDLDRVNTAKARLFLDGPLAPEGRVTGEARQLFLEMNGAVLRTPPAGSGLDVAPAYPRLGEIAAPVLVICGDLEFPHIQDRCRHIAATVQDGTFHGLAGTAHLPSLDQPVEVSGLVAGFVARCSRG